MKKEFLLILIVALIPIRAVFGEPIHSFEELKSALCAGKQFVFIGDFKECTGDAGMPVGYFTPASMMLVGERIITSHLHFTDYLGYPAYEYVKYTFTSDNSVCVQTTIYDARNFIVQGIPHTVSCTIGSGFTINLNH